MNNTKDLVKFLISEFSIQTEQAMKIKNPKHNYGKVKQLTYMVDSPKKVAQRLTWDNFKGTTFLSPDEIKEVEKTFQLNLVDEFAGNNSKKKKCIKILCTIDVKECAIRGQFEYIDNEIVKFEI